MAAKPDTPEGIATWAENKAKPSEGPSYKRLTDSERLAILTQHEKGESYESIAKRLNRSLDTVHQVIKTYAPTVNLAKRRLQAAAERMAENIIENGLPRDHVATLKGINVLEESDSSVPKVVVQIGVLGGDVQVSLSPLPERALGEGE
jgi:hypothetical protein